MTDKKLYRKDWSMIGELNSLLGQMDQDDIEEVLEIAKIKLNRKKKSDDFPADIEIIEDEKFGKEFLDSEEKALVRDMHREAHLKIVSDLRRLGADKDFFKLFNDFLFLEHNLDRAVYGNDEGIETKTKENLIKTSYNILKKLIVIETKKFVTT